MEVVGVLLDNGVARGIHFRWFRPLVGLGSCKSVVRLRFGP